MHPEAAQWIRDFETNTDTAGPTNIVHGLICLGVDNPECPELRKKWFGNSSCVFDWIIQNQSTYNAAIHRVLLSWQGLVSKLRRVMRTDLTRHDETFPEYGRIALHSYTRSLLDHFLKFKPNPAWVKG